MNREGWRKTSFTIKQVSKSFIDEAINFTRTIQFEVDGIILGTRENSRVDLPPVEDQMRLFVNKIIDRVFEDRKRGIFHWK